MSRQEEPREYYFKVTNSYSKIHNDEAIEAFFIETEADEWDGQPKHSRVLSVIALEGILSEFIQDCARSVAIGSQLDWDGVLPLPSSEISNQPLGFDDDFGGTEF